MSFIALVDCNNFFVSCERLFNPKLMHRPVVVLSNNDGCIVARSQEVKALGVPMGAPYFQWADFLHAHHVFVCSSNFSLYGDLSQRVMQTLHHCNPELEIYSIDEAFLHIENEKDPLSYCHKIRQQVLQWTGIPVSIGIAPTKTLAKIANRTAKKDPSCQGVCFPSTHEISHILQNLEVGEIWGIGRRLSQFLAKKGIYTAAQLRDQPDLWVKHHLSVIGLRTVWELRGIPCLNLEEAPSAKQSIMTSRSFSRPICTIEEMKEAVCTYTARGAEKLREEKSLASWLQVFVMTRETSHYVQMTLPQPTAYTPTLLEYANQVLSSIFRSGSTYKKAGILLGGLVPANRYQQDLFVARDTASENKKKTAMALLDRANETFGYPILQFASEGTTRSWKGKRENSSPCFTTRWDELLTICI